MVISVCSGDPLARYKLVIQDARSAHEALCLDLRVAEHFVEARFMIHVELVASQLDDSVLVFERCQANWAVPALQELELVSLPRLAASLNKLNQFFPLADESTVSSDFVSSWSTAVVFTEEISVFKRHLTSLAFGTLIVWQLIKAFKVNNHESRRTEENSHQLELCKLKSPRPTFPEIRFSFHDHYAIYECNWQTGVDNN